jgi:cytochrome c oxidase subunit IV
MNEQFQKALAEILTLLTESAKAVGSTAQTEIPLLVQEYLRWALWSNLLFGLAGLIVVPLVWRFGKRVWVNNADEDVIIPLCIFGIPVLGGITLATAFALYNALKVFIAPRVYLLEKAAELIK